MGFNRNLPAAVAEPPVAAAAPAVEAQAPAPVAEPSYPKQEAPRANEFAADIAALIGGSDKDMRMFYCGLYQAVLQSAPTFTTGLIKDLNHWHQIVDAEVDHYVRRILEKAKK